ncbi:MAG: glycogen/starch synthase [Patescibacteria group bacterium]|nr:glycogen/starch synthase [Patescibacteria group bacterium]
MKILFAASEVNPILKVGGIADVVSALTKALRKISQHDIRIVIPYYQPVKEKKFGGKKIARFKVKIGAEEEVVNVYKIFLPKTDIPVYFLENKKYLTNGGVYLDIKKFDHIKRFLFFSLAIPEFLKVIDWQPDVIHAHDWQAGFVPVILKLKKIKIKVLFTIHNLLTQGCWNSDECLKFLGLKADFKKSNDFNIMQQAILNADLITTVSPSYAEEIKTKFYGRGLEKEIKSRSKDFSGILNGIDVDIFNPLTDRSLVRNYSIKNLEDKLFNKIYLQKKCGFEISKNIPLLGVISRLDEQKGIDLICEITDELVENNCQMIILGTGQSECEKMVKEIQRKYPHNICFFVEFNPELAQQIYAGADIFLMPSKFEPCGLCQMIAMRYGTIPIVRATGGLRDTVKNVKLNNDLSGLNKRVIGNGFSFSDYNSQKFLVAIKRALKFYQNKKIWRKIQINAMSQDFSWHQSAKKYLKLYNKLISK